MDFTSKELQNAVEVPSSFTYVKPVEVDTENIKNEIKLLILNKNKQLINAYDMASLERVLINSGNEVLKSFVKLMRDYTALKYRDDTIKSLTSRKIFDIILLNLDCLSINGIDSAPEEVYALLSGFLVKNFI